jgi:hypothetical protein
VLTNSLVISIPTSKPLFQSPSIAWSSSYSRFGFFVAAETSLFAIKYLCVPSRRRLQRPP